MQESHREGTELTAEQLLRRRRGLGDSAASLREEGKDLSQKDLDFSNSSSSRIVFCLDIKTHGDTFEDYNNI